MAAHGPAHPPGTAVPVADEWGAQAMTPEAVLLALIAALLVTALLVFYRLTNSRGQFTWDIRTVEPESSILRVERDEARRQAEQMRDEMRRADTMPPEAE